MIMNEKYMEAFEKYNKRFKDGFPSIPLLNYGEEKCIEMIEKCLKENKDVYEMGFLELDDDIIY